MNPILDTRMYQAEFTRGKVTEFTANVIDKWMYAQCDTDGYEYLLLDLIVDYHKDNKAISLTEQQIGIWDRLVTHKTTVGCQICCQWKECSTS